MSLESAKMGKISEHFSDTDMLIIKPQKKNPLISAMILLALLMICGVYFCLICLKQKGFIINPNSMRIEQIERSCPNPNISKSEVPYVHYPEPTTYRRNECRCTPVRFFAILSMQRSGSGWFETLLNSHINISSNGEIFSVKVRRSNMSTITETLDKVYNLDWFSSASKNECTSAVGFKWMLNQGLLQNHDDIVSYFDKRGVSAIFLFRRNLLRRWVSILANNHDRDTKQLNGTHKAHVHSKDDADVLARYKPKINESLLIPTLKQADKWTIDALKYFKGNRHIVLYYEDLAHNRTKLKEVLEFLRVPQRKLKSRQVKIHTRPLSEQIENWDAVSKALKGTEYESFLQSD
ncbi:uncharacterized protein A4U43_C10F7520 [Asparagus officinalis]|uniref:Sulfotransferase n=1 Tax=Asparagus officinalis TaxID=4686 RepID=A0A5P1E197_ASPOF|nr:uncharacterized protein LOC109825827 [Asparagus officinalis]ONK56351.1 uncharacterized protein A4U43_C10F7520 [Asparagus officinalis]